MIPYIRLEELTREVRDLIEERGDITHLWSDDWSPEFYRAQAELGMIAVSARGPAPASDAASDSAPAHVILPELQEAYAVLDWSDLHLDRSVRRILRSGRAEEEPLELHIDTDPGPVLAELDRFWGRRSWLCPEYQGVIRRLSASAGPGFRLWGVRLTAGAGRSGAGRSGAGRSDSAEETAAGELGYTIGRTYTSLTGFHHRRPEWDSLGKLQMVLLARRLEAAGLAFWNLGHPHLPYKRRLGARTLPRRSFLERWDRAAAGPAADIRRADSPPV